MAKYITRTYKYQECKLTCAHIEPGKTPAFVERTFIVDCSFGTDVEIIADVAARGIPFLTPCAVISKTVKAEKRRMLMADFIRQSELVCAVNPDSVNDEE